MEKRQNPTYLKYVDAILSEFPSKEPGHGCFLLRQIIGKRGKKYTQEQIQTITVVLCNLVENNYLVSDDNSLHGFIKLSDALVDYQYGAAIAVNRIDLASYIDGSPGRAQSFEVIWRIIGVENEAPFYVPGPLYFNMIRPYVPTGCITYSEYIEYRSAQGIGTSRRVWYRELFNALKEEQVIPFLQDLSYGISLLYYFVEVAEDADWPADQRTNTILAELPVQQLALPIQTTQAGLNDIAREICNNYKAFIEDNRMYKLLQNDDGSWKNETSAQLLFYTITRNLCKSHNVDLSRESDSGIGRLDMKVSFGYAKVAIEMKLSTNADLEHGYEKQLPAYMRAEEADYGIYLIVDIPGGHTDKLESVRQMGETSTIQNIEVIIVDAHPKSAASTL